MLMGKKKSVSSQQRVYEFIEVQLNIPGRIQGDKIWVYLVQGSITKLHMMTERISTDNQQHSHVSKIPDRDYG